MTGDPRALSAACAGVARAVAAEPGRLRRCFATGLLVFTSAAALAGLDTPAALADFLGLDEVVVDRALRFLAAIGHLARQDGRLTLTELGQRSVRDDKRYLVTRQDRRVLYFDAFGSRPLTSPYYDAAVTLLSPGQAQAVAAAGEWPRFRPLGSTHGFRPEGLAELARHPERRRFNLPERIDEPEVLGAAEHAFLPMYLVRATGPGQRVRPFAYTQAGDTADLDVSEMCERTPEISSLIETEEASAPDFPQKAARWLGGLKLGGYRARVDARWPVAGHSAWLSLRPRCGAELSNSRVVRGPGQGHPERLV